MYMRAFSRQETDLTETDCIGLADGLGDNGLRSRLLLAGAAGLAGAERLWSRRR